MRYEDFGVRRGDDGRLRLQVLRLRPGVQHKAPAGGRVRPGATVKARMEAANGLKEHEDLQPRTVHNEDIRSR